MRLLKTFLVSFVLNFSFNLTAASANYTNGEFQKSFRDVGYKPVYEALKVSSSHFKHDIALPVHLPPVSFTHSFGRFTNSNGEINDSIEIEYINKDSTNNHNMIWIKPSQKTREHSSA